MLANLASKQVAGHLAHLSILDSILRRTTSGFATNARALRGRQ